MHNKKAILNLVDSLPIEQPFDYTVEVEDKKVLVLVHPGPELEGIPLSVELFSGGEIRLSRHDTDEFVGSINVGTRIVKRNALVEFDQGEEYNILHIECKRPSQRKLRLKAK